MVEKLIEVTEAEDFIIPDFLKTNLKEFALIANDAMRLLTKTERTAFLFTLIILLKDYIVFSNVSDANNLEGLNKFIHEYRTGETSITGIG